MHPTSLKFPSHRRMDAVMKYPNSPLTNTFLISTSNHNFPTLYGLGPHIASYLISTSNHNYQPHDTAGTRIASYLISTSNHNLPLLLETVSRLLLISFLHQTTTRILYLRHLCDCFLSHFYIKPQPSPSTT